MTELSLTIGNRKINATVEAEDLCMSELFELFRGLLVGHGFIDESYVETCREIAYEEGRTV